MACKYTYKGVTYNSKEEFVNQIITPQFLEPTKTRRILEVQSDLFQKGRDKKSLIDRYSPLHDENETLKIIESNYWDGRKVFYYQVIKKDTGQPIRNVNDIEFTTLKEAQDNLKKIIDEFENPSENKFLQLLNKDNNWAAFFVKSIIQDSAKKGYEKILFPLGNTASKVEGQTTIEEFKKLKEEQIKKLEESSNDLKEGIENPESRYKSELKRYQNKTGFIQYNDKNAFIEVSKTLIKNNEKEINQLKNELIQIEGPEGLAAFAPIHNFYENTITNILKKEGYNPTLITDEYGNQWNQIIIDNVRDLKPILLQKGTVKPTSISILNKMADDFQSRYNITFKVIRESEAMRLLDKNNVPNAFYYEPTNTAYIVEGKANEISVVHELGHAFLYKIKNDNIKLYNNLVEEARNMPEITDYVNRVYGQISKDKYEQEVIMRAIDLYNQDKLDAKENKGLIDLITEFLLSISSYIKDLLGFERIDVNIIEPDTKLKDIADLLYLYKGNMDLSTKNKTQNFTYDERQNIRNIVNGNESEGIGNIAESARNYIVRSNKTSGGSANNEKGLLEQFLIDNPQFMYNIDENLLGTQFTHGTQSKIYMKDDDTRHVYKKSWLNTHGGILDNLTSILLHNMLFKNVEYEVLGFYIADDFEKYNIILKQKHVLKDKEYNYDAIVTFLNHNGFTEKNGVFINLDLKIKITDLHEGNVFLRGDELFFIDPMITAIPNSRDIHLGKVLEQLPEQNENKSITVDEFYNKYQDKVINMLDIKKIENFNKDKGYAAINVIKRNDGKYIAIKNSEKVIQSDNNFIPTYQGLLSGNNPIKFYKTGNNYNINPLSNNTFYINEPVEIDEKGNAIIQDYNNIIPTNEIKTIINERFKDNNDYYLNNLLKDIKLSNYLTSEEADRYAEFIKNVNINRNQKYIIDIVDNKGFKELDIIADDNNIIDINSNFSPTTIRAIEDKGLNIEEMNNPLLLSLQSLITNGELSEELTCKI